MPQSRHAGRRRIDKSAEHRREEVEVDRECQWHGRGQAENNEKSFDGSANEDVQGAHASPVSSTVVRGRRRSRPWSKDRSMRYHGLYELK